MRMSACTVRQALVCGLAAAYHARSYSTHKAGWLSFGSSMPAAYLSTCSFKGHELTSSGDQTGQCWPILLQVYSVEAKVQHPSRGGECAPDGIPVFCHPAQQ